MKKFSTNHLLGGIAALFFLTLMLCWPQQSADGIYQGLVSCAKQVIPALFPFFVVSALIIASPLAEWLGILLYPYTRFVLGIRDRSASTALLVSWLGGFAVAANTISQLYLQGHINRRQADLLLACGVGSGPAFVINTVGLLMLKNINWGICLYGALLCANLVTGVFLRVIFCFLKETHTVYSEPQSSASTLSSGGFVAAVGQAVRSMLTVCGFVVFFRFLCTVLPSALHLASTGAFATNAFLEVTSGCASAINLAGNAPIFCCCAALSLQSLSVFLQVRALLCHELSLNCLLAVRPIHLVFSLLFLRLLLTFLPDTVSAFSSLAPQVIPIAHTAPDAALVLFFLCCAVLYQLDRAHGRISFAKKPA